MGGLWLVVFLLLIFQSSSVSGYSNDNLACVWYCRNSVLLTKYWTGITFTIKTETQPLPVKEEVPVGVTPRPLGKKLQQELMLKTIILWRQNFCLPWLRPPPLQMGGNHPQNMESLPRLPQRLPSQHACREALHAVISAVWPVSRMTGHHGGQVVSTVCVTSGPSFSPCRAC